MKYKRCMVTKPVKIPEDVKLIESGTCEKGDVVLVKIKKVNFCPRILNADNVKENIYDGDLLLGCLSNRYATKVLHGEVPKKLKKGDIIQRLEVAGAIGIVLSTRAGYVPTDVEFLGFVTNDNKKLNLKNFSLPLKNINKLKDKPVVVTVGADMSSGKTTTVVELTRALTKMGLKVGVAKITGIGNPKDMTACKEAGATNAFTMIDAGSPSTLNDSEEELENIFLSLASNLVDNDIILIEIADGILERETDMLLSNRTIKKYATVFIFSCNDSVCAYGGMLLLEKKGIRPLIMSGLGTRSELSRKEIENITKIRAFNPKEQGKEMAEYIVKQIGLKI